MGGGGGRQGRGGIKEAGRGELGWKVGVGLHGAYLELMSLMRAFSSFKLPPKRPISCRHPKHTLRG